MSVRPETAADLHDNDNDPRARNTRADVYERERYADHGLIQWRYRYDGTR